MLWDWNVMCWRLCQGFVTETPAEDIDVVVVGNGIQMAEEFAKSLGRGARIAVFKSYGTAQVKHKGIEIEFVVR